MALPIIQITVRDLPNTEAIENRVRLKLKRLERFYERIESIHVVIEEVQKHQSQGKLYTVNIDVLVPHKKIVVNKQQDVDLYVAMRDAFAAVTRQLEEYSRIQRGYVKAHPTQSLKKGTSAGQIKRLFKDEHYGFIQDNEGREIFFDFEHLLKNHYFDQLEIGMIVNFIEIVDSSNRVLADEVAIAA